MKIVTIISETILTHEIIGLAKELGAKGFTITDVRGEGSSNRHSGEIPDIKTKVEVVCDGALAAKLIKRVSDTYFRDYSLIIYASDVEVVRADKF